MQLEDQDNLAVAQHGRARDARHVAQMGPSGLETISCCVDDCVHQQRDAALDRVDQEHRGALVHRATG